MFLVLNREAYVNMGAGEVEKLRQEWSIKCGGDSKKMKLEWEADGEWYNGKFTNVRENRHKVKVYSCTFQTLDRDVLDLDHKETKKLLKAYLEVQAYRRRQHEEDLISKTKRKEETGNGEESGLESSDATEDDEDGQNDHGTESSPHQDDTDGQTMEVP